MRKSEYFLGVVAAAAGVLTAATPAVAADSSGNDGLKIGNGNNVSVPVQACGNNIAVAGVVAPVGSSHGTGCANGSDSSSAGTGASQAQGFPVAGKPSDSGSGQAAGQPSGLGTNQAGKPSDLGSGQAGKPSGLDSSQVAGQPSDSGSGQAAGQPSGSGNNLSAQPSSSNSNQTGQHSGSGSSQSSLPSAPQPTSVEGHHSVTG